MVGFPLLMLFGVLSNTLAQLTRESCASYQSNALFKSALNVMTQADSVLVPSKFARVVDGFLIAIVDETSGESDGGGGTNPFGAYATILFTGSEILPEGICSIPANGNAPRCGTDGDGLTDSFMLGPVDAIAFLHCTASPMKYMGHDLIIGTRFTEEYPYYPGQNFGDAINHLNINITDSETLGVFNAPSLIIMSGDGQAIDDISQAYQKVGVPATSISARAVTHNTIRFWDRSGGKDWTASNPDALGYIYRITAPVGGLNSSDYISYKKMRFPVKFYFADDENTGSMPLSPVLKDRYSESVVDENKEWKDALTQLNQSIQSVFAATYQAEYLRCQITNYTGPGNYDDWDYILAQKNNGSFVAGTRDAIYGAVYVSSYEELYSYALKPEQAYVLFGIMHSKVLNASYSSSGLDIVDAFVPNSFLESHWFLDDQLEGSAHRYLDSDIADNLFAVDFFAPGGCANHAIPEWCVEFNATTYNTSLPWVFLGERVYSVLETGIGPSANTTVPSGILIFSLPADEKKN